MEKWLEWSCSLHRSIALDIWRLPDYKTVDKFRLEVLNFLGLYSRIQTAHSTAWEQQILV